MKKQDLRLAVFMTAAVLLLAGVMTQNYLLAVRPPGGPRIDVAKVKAGIKKAGIVPHEAKYWRVLR